MRSSAGRFAGKGASPRYGGEGGGKGRGARGPGGASEEVQETWPVGRPAIACAG